MALVDFRVQHRNHTGGVISTHNTVDNSLRWKYNANEVGDISYDLSLYDDPALVSAEPDSFAPYKTDYLLQMSLAGGSWQAIQGGIHTSVNLRPRSGVVSVAGKDWLHWLEQSVWFDGYNRDFSEDDLSDIINADAGGYSYDGNGFHESDYSYAWVGDQGAKHKDVISWLIQNSKTGRLATSVNLNPIYHGFAEAGGTAFSYVIIFQDQTTILDHIKSLAQMHDPYGYDFYVDWDKKLHFFGPRKVVTAAVTPIWVLTDENVVIDTVPDFDWTGNGPIATHVIGLGPGNPAVWWIRKDQESIDKFRHWLKLQNVGETYSRSSLDGIISSIRRGTEGLQYIFAQRDLNLSIYPDKVNPSDPTDGFRNHTGDVVRFKWEIWPYHTINAYYWITEQEFTGDNAGNWTCALGLEQIYDVQI